MDKYKTISQEYKNMNKKFSKLQCDYYNYIIVYKFYTTWINIFIIKSIYSG